MSPVSECIRKGSMKMADLLKPIEMEDIARYQIPSALHYSPDGKYLAFEVIRMDLEENEYHTDIYVSESGKAGSARRMTWSIDANIVLWDDNDTLLIRRIVPKKNCEADPAAAGTTALFRLPVHGGEARPYLTLPFPLEKLEKLDPDGAPALRPCRYIAAAGIRMSDPDAYLDTPEQRKEKAEKEKAEQDYHVVDEVPYWFNGAGYINGMRTALFLVEAQEDKAVFRRLTEPAFDLDSFCVDKDSGKVYFAGAEKHGLMSMFSRLYVWNAGTGETESLWDKDDLSFGSLFMLDGRLYAHASDMKTYGLNQTSDIYAVSKDNVQKVFIPPVTLGSSVLGDTAEGGNGSYAGEGEYLTLATVEDHNAVFSLKPEAAGRLSCRTLWEKPGLVCTMTASRDRIAVIYQDWGQVAEVFEMDRDGSGMMQVTHLNDSALEGCYVAEPHRVDYISCGLDLHGWVLLPQGYTPEKKYPAVLDIHGGPRCVYGETFFHEMQLWAARGFIVFFINIKGSDGRGDAFADIRGDYGGTDYKNLMDFTDAVLLAYPNIDKERICETGGSYGGFMTNWIIGHTDRFCCAASQRSISNWISMSFISDIGSFFGPDQSGADGLFGDRNTEALWARSPLKYAADVKTPTLFIHSEEDYRCPLPEGMQMMQALVNNGVETRMVIFKGENHELSRSGKPKHRVRRLKEITEWFEKHTG